MGLALPKFLAGIASLVLGIVANIHAIIPHYTVQAYDSRVIAGIHSGVNPGGPVLLAIPPINYLLIGIGCGLIIVGLVLIFSVVFRRASLPLTA